MAQQQESTWHRLTCNSCGNCQRFFRSHYLIWKAGGGVSEEPAGIYCAECMAIVDTGKLIEMEQLRLKKEELRALKQEIGVE